MLELKQRSYLLLLYPTLCPIASEMPQRNPRALKNKIKHYWACWFLRSLLASIKPYLCLGTKRNFLEVKLRWGEFGKSAFKKEERSLQVENIPSESEVFLFSLRKCSRYRQRKQYWISYVTERRECSKCWMFPADVSAILQNSLTPITAWVLDELNQCEIFLPWFL